MKKIAFFSIVLLFIFTTGLSFAQTLSGFYMELEPEEGNSWKYGLVYKPDYGYGICCVNLRILQMPETDPRDQMFSSTFGTRPGWVNYLSPDNLVRSTWGPRTNDNHQGFSVWYEIGNYNNSPQFVVQVQAFGGPSSNPSLCSLLDNQEFYYDASDTDGSHWWRNPGAYGGSNGNMGTGMPSGYYSGIVWNNTTCPIPEPGTILLLGSGFLGLGFIGWYRRRKA